MILIDIRGGACPSFPSTDRPLQRCCAEVAKDSTVARASHWGGEKLVGGCSDVSTPASKVPMKHAHAFPSSGQMELSQW
jgi:hypothetical protein